MKNRTQGEQVGRLLRTCSESGCDEINSILIEALIDNKDYHHLIEKIILWSETDEDGTSCHTGREIAQMIFIVAVYQPDQITSWLKSLINKSYDLARGRFPNYSSQRRLNSGLVAGSAMIANWLIKDRVFNRDDSHRNLEIGQLLAVIIFLNEVGEVTDSTKKLFKQISQIQSPIIDSFISVTTEKLSLVEKINSSTHDILVNIIYGLLTKKLGHKNTKPNDLAQLIKALQI